MTAETTPARRRHRTARGLMAIAALAGALTVTQAPSGPVVRATGQSSISLDEPFTGATLNNPGDWISVRGGTWNEWPCLTAATASLSASSGSVEACSTYVAGTATPGDGALRLTRNKGAGDQQDAAASLMYTATLSASEGIDVSFSIRIGDQGLADGMSFFLKDGSNVTNSVGAAGGSLGYGMGHTADAVTPTGNGIPGALLGVGFDKWGNFSWNGVASSSCGAQRGTHNNQGSPGIANQNMLVVRGPDTSGAKDGSAGFCYLSRAQVAYNAASFQRVRVVVPPYTPGQPVTVSVYLAPTATPTVIPGSPTIAQSVTITATTFKFGFSAAHGWAGNSHELRGLSIRPAGPAITTLATSASTGSGTGPTSGGTLLTITGTSISATATVTIDGQACGSVTVSGDGTQLTCLTPAGTPGTKQVVITNPNGGPGLGTFTYVNPTPTVSAVSPSSGVPAGGNTITITGTGFVAGATVSVGNQPCTSVNVSSTTSLTCVVPPGTEGAVVDVAVTNVGTAAGTGVGLYTYRTASVVLPLIPTTTTAPPTTTTTVPPATTTPPSTVAPATTVPAPVPADANTGVLPEVEPGDSLVTEDGVPTPVELVVEDRTDLVLRGQDFVLRLRGECAAGCEVQTDANGRETIELESDGAARVSGEGFLPGTPVYVWLFSEPRFLGEFTVQADGTFLGRVPLEGVEVGTHTLQVNGTSFDGVARSANLGVIVAPAAVPSPGDVLLPATGGSGSGASLAILLLAVGAVLLGAASRRTHRQTAP